MFNQLLQPAVELCLPRRLLSGHPHPDTVRQGYVQMLLPCRHCGDEVVFQYCPLSCGMTQLMLSRSHL